MSRLADDQKQASEFIGYDWDCLPERLALARVYHDVARVIGWNAAVSFGMTVWREKRPPSRSNSARCGVIYIPAKLSRIYGIELIRIAGERNAAALVKEFPAHRFEFPNIVSASIGRRNRAIIQHLEDGLSPDVVACAFGITRRHVRRISTEVRTDIPAMEHMSA